MFVRSSCRRIGVSVMAYCSLSLFAFFVLAWQTEAADMQERLSAVEEELEQEKEGHREDVEALQHQLKEERCRRLICWFLSVVESDVRDSSLR